MPKSIASTSEEINLTKLAMGGKFLINTMYLKSTIYKCFYHLNMK